MRMIPERHKGRYVFIETTFFIECVRVDHTTGKKIEKRYTEYLPLSFIFRIFSLPKNTHYSDG